MTRAMSQDPLYERAGFGQAESVEEVMLDKAISDWDWKDTPLEFIEQGLWQRKPANEIIRELIRRLRAIDQRTIATQPDCWHEKCDEAGICLACGKKARIQLPFTVGAAGSDLLGEDVGIQSEIGQINELHAEQVIRTAQKIKSLAADPSGGTAALTSEGRERAPQVDAPVDADEMFQRCVDIVTPSQAAILQALREVHPRAIAKAELAGKANVSAASSGYTNNLGALRSAGMIDYPQQGMARLSDWVVLEGD